MSSKGRNGKKKKTGVTLEAYEVTLFILRVIVSVYCCMFFVAMPLFYHNKYFDIGDFKYTMFMYLTVTFLSLSSIMLVIHIIVLGVSGRIRLSYLKERFMAMSMTDLFVIAFGMASVISFLLSPIRTDEYPVFFLFNTDKNARVVNLPWEGYRGWNMGLRSQLMFVAMYFLISRLFMKSWKKDLICISLSSAFAVFLLGVLNRFHIDPLGMYDGLVEGYINKFLSTLGQATWYSSFMVVMLPVGMALYMFCDRKWTLDKCLLALYVSIGGATFVTQNSDSAYPAFAAIIVMMFAISFMNNERFLRFLEMMILMLGAMKVVGLFQILFPQRLTELDRMSLFVSQSPVTLVLLIALTGLYIVILKKTDSGRFDIIRYKRLRTAVVLCMAACVPLVIIIAYLNTKGMLPTDALAGVEYLTFNDSWGNNRGYTWRNTVEVMREPLWRSMIFTGPGPDCYPMVMYADDIRASMMHEFWNGEIVICAHNEWLNMLFNEGILGFVTYLGIFGSAFVSCARKYDNPVSLACASAIAGYFFHNMFCYQQILCTPMIFCVMALYDFLNANKEMHSEK